MVWATQRFLLGTELKGGAGEVVSLRPPPGFHRHPVDGSTWFVSFADNVLIRVRACSFTFVATLSTDRASLKLCLQPFRPLRVRSAFRQ